MNLVHAWAPGELLQLATSDIGIAIDVLLALNSVIDDSDGRRELSMCIARYIWHYKELFKMFKEKFDFSTADSMVNWMLQNEGSYEFWGPDLDVWAKIAELCGAEYVATDKDWYRVWPSHFEKADKERNKARWSEWSAWREECYGRR